MNLKVHRFVENVSLMQEKVQEHQHNSQGKNSVSTIIRRASLKSC